MALNRVQAILNLHKTNSEEDRTVLKDLLSRYRSIKRLIRRSSNVLIKDPCELETIPEGTEIQLTLASPQHRINIEMNHAANNHQTSSKLLMDQTELMPATSLKHETQKITEDMSEEEGDLNLHAMSRYVFMNLLQIASCIFVGLSGAVSRSRCRILTVVYKIQN